MKNVQKNLTKLKNMEIDHLNKIYELSHIHEFDCGHVDKKLIGVFYLKKILKML